MAEPPPDDAERRRITRRARRHAVRRGRRGLGQDVVARRADPRAGDRTPACRCARSPPSRSPTRPPPSCATGCGARSRSRLPRAAPAARERARGSPARARRRGRLHAACLRPTPAHRAPARRRPAAPRRGRRRGRPRSSPSTSAGPRSSTSCSTTTGSAPSPTTRRPSPSCSTSRAGLEVLRDVALAFERELGPRRRACRRPAARQPAAARPHRAPRRSCSSSPGTRDHGARRGRAGAGPRPTWTTRLGRWRQRRTAQRPARGRSAPVGGGQRRREPGNKQNWRAAACGERPRPAARPGRDAVAAQCRAARQVAIEACLRRIAVRLGDATVAAAASAPGRGPPRLPRPARAGPRAAARPGRGPEAQSHAAHQRYTRLLLDEFQDTDPIQVEIATLLTAPPSAVAADWRALVPEPGRLFLVGDPKQSIYRFRRADIATFLAARDALDRAARWRSLPTSAPRHPSWPGSTRSSSSSSLRARRAARLPAPRGRPLRGARPARPCC